MSDPLYYANERHEVATLLPVNYRRVLEVGCGMGAFRSNLSGDHEYWGVEFSPAAAKQAALCLDRVFTGTYDDVKDSLPDAYFDLVVCNDVIEHMSDHDSFLDSIMGKLTSNGFLVGSVPNVRSAGNLQALLLRRDWQYADSGVLDRTHLRFFTRGSWERSLLHHGFCIDVLEGINAGSGNVGRRQRLLDHLTAWVLGSDTRYLQFAFRARPASSARG